jgi:adenylate cyclase
MQLAMATVNEQNKEDGLPEVEMGIGINTGQVVAGNIGSPERAKYGVVGSQVNLTSRIQSFTTGGQILISEATRREVGAILKIGKQMDVEAKGIEHPVTLCEVLGIEGPHRLYLPETTEALVLLAAEIPFRYAIVEGDRLSGEMFKGRLTKLSRTGAEACLQNPVPTLSGLKMYLLGTEGEEIPGALYGKVVGRTPGSSTSFSIRFTSMSLEIRTFLAGRRRSGPSDVVS